MVAAGAGIHRVQVGPGAGAEPIARGGTPGAPGVDDLGSQQLWWGIIIDLKGIITRLTSKILGEQPAITGYNWLLIRDNAASNQWLISSSYRGYNYKHQLM